MSRHIIQRYVEEWTVAISDVTPLVRKLEALIRAGHADRAQEQLPHERVYDIPRDIGHRLGML